MAHLRAVSKKFDWGVTAATIAVFSLVLAVYFLGPVWGLCQYAELPHQSPRHKLIYQVCEELSNRAGLSSKPVLVLGPSIASASSGTGYAIISIGPELIDESSVSDEDLRAIIAHEIGHIVRDDSHRIRWFRSQAEDHELSADRIAGQLVGCDAFKSLVNNQLKRFENAFWNEKDPHPSPAKRIRAACSESSSRTTY